MEGEKNTAGGFQLQVLVFISNCIQLWLWDSELLSLQFCLRILQCTVFTLYPDFIMKKWPEMT